MIKCQSLFSSSVFLSASSDQTHGPVDTFSQTLFEQELGNIAIL